MNTEQVSNALAHFVHLNWLWFTAFVGANLFQSAFSKWCLMEEILKKAGIGKAQRAAS